MATLAQTPRRRPAAWSPNRNWRKFTATATVTLFGLFVVLIFLMPLGYMSLTAFKTKKQIGDPFSQLLPSSPVDFTYQGKDYPLYNVPTETGTHQWALVKKLRTRNDQGENIYVSTFVDPANVDAGLIETDLNWFQLRPVYELDPTLLNFPNAWEAINLGRLFRNTLIIAIAGTIGTLLSSVLVAYGFSRFRIPGINILF